MDKQIATRVLSSKVMPLLCLLIFSPYVSTTTNAQEVDRWQLQKQHQLGRSIGSRLTPVRNRNCKYCEEKEVTAKLEYQARVLSGEDSIEYQKEIESMIFTNDKFVNGCWKNANAKGVEVFFTVSESGKASDFAFFPKNKVRRCIKRHIAKIEFPSIDEPHHAWLVTSGK